MIESATATISATQLGPDSYQYNLTLTDTGTTPLGTFWFPRSSQTPASMRRVASWNSLRPPFATGTRGRPILHAAARFFAWCDRHYLGQFADIEPPHVAAYIEPLGKDFEMRFAPTVSARPTPGT